MGVADIKQILSNTHRPAKLVQSNSIQFDAINFPYQNAGINFSLFHNFRLSIRQSEEKERSKFESSDWSDKSSLLETI